MRSKRKTAKSKQEQEFSKRLIADIRGLLWTVTIGGLALAAFCIYRSFQKVGGDFVVSQPFQNLHDDVGHHGQDQGRCQDCGDGHYDKIPTNFLAVGISMVVTLVAFFAVCAIAKIAITSC